MTNIAGSPCLWIDNPLDSDRTNCGTCRNSGACLAAGLTESQLVALDKLSTVHRIVNKNGVLHYALKPQTSVHVVSTGSFRSVISDEGGAEQVTNFHFPGEIIGLDTLGGHLPQTTVIANERSMVFEISEALMSDLCAQNEDLNQAFNCALRNEIVSGQNHILLLARMSADARVARFILDLSKRHERRGHSPREFTVNIARHDTANYLGLAPETLSRVIHKLQDMEYCIVKRGRMVILNMDRLYELAGAIR